MREVAQNRQSEEDELEGLLTWFSIHLEDAETNPLLQQEVIKKRGERKAVVRDTLRVHVHQHNNLSNQALTTELSQGFSTTHGVFVKSLDNALRSFNVESQAYYGGTFIGNHVHSAL